MLHVLQAALAAVFPALVIAAAMRDAVSYTISNWFSIALIAAFAIAAPVFGLSAGDIGLHLAVGVVALLLGMAMFALNWIGGGDAKLFAAAALWLGWPAAMTYGAMTAIAGGVLSIGILTLRSAYVRPYIMIGPAWFLRLTEPGENVPYGLAIAAGALAAFPASPMTKALTPF